MDQNINPDTGLPHTISLAEVMEHVQLAPSEVATLFAHWGQAFHGTAQSDLGAKMNEVATAVVDPRFHGMKAPDPAQQNMPSGQPRRPAVVFDDEEPQQDFMSPPLQPEMSRTTSAPNPTDQRAPDVQYMPANPPTDAQNAPANTPANTPVTTANTPVTPTSTPVDDSDKLGI